MTHRKNYILYDTTSYWVNKLNYLIVNNLEKQMKRFDITHSQWTVLLPLYGGKIKTPQKLAKYIGIDKAAIKRILDRLEKKGFIIRKKDQNDGRYTCIDLTDKGQAIVPKLIMSSQDCDSTFFEGLSNEEIFMFKAVINKMLRNFDISKFI